MFNQMNQTNNGGVPASSPQPSHSPDPSAIPVSLAPLHLLPPLVSAYLPSQPPPSVVDQGRQRPDQISILQMVTKTGEVQSMQVRKRGHATDGVRQQQRKKKRTEAAAAGTINSNTMSGLGIKELPDRLDLNIPESGLINQLVGLEKRLDATIARKHVEMQQALHPPKQTAQIIRVFIWHEHTTPLTHDELMNGMTQHDKPESQAWILKIQGQILDAEPPGPDGQIPPTPPNQPPVRCLSNYLSSIVIQIEGKPIPLPMPGPPLTTPTETIEWRKHSAIALSDGFEIRRRGGGDVTLKISLFLDHSPARFKLSPALSHALGFPLYAPNVLPQHATHTNPHPFLLYETQSNVLAAFWEYVKKNNLQDPKNPTVIKCDAVLINLFGVGELPVSSVLSFLQLHMAPASAEPIIIPYHIHQTIPSPQQPSQFQMNNTGIPAPSPSPQSVFDILTYTPVMPNLGASYQEASTFSGLKSLPPPSLLPQTQKQTDKLMELMFEIEKCNRRREFLQAFSEAPTQVIQLLLAQHAKDQLLMVGLTGVDDELERRGEYYHAEWQYDAVDRLMAEEANQQTTAIMNSASMFDETQDE